MEVERETEKRGEQECLKKLREMKREKDKGVKSHLASAAADSFSFSSFN